MRDDFLKSYHLEKDVEDKFPLVWKNLVLSNQVTPQREPIGVIICTCPKEISWLTTIERGDAQKSLGIVARYVSKEHHDLVVTNLAQNADYVLKHGKPDFLEVYSRTEKLFDSKIDDKNSLIERINNELNRSVEQQRDDDLQR